MKTETLVQTASFSKAGQHRDHTTRRSGFAYCLASYLWFSVSVFWFKAVSNVPVWEILAHRIIGSAVLLIAFLAATGRLKAAVRVFTDGTTIVTLAATAFLIGCSWCIYIWAVIHDRILDTSLAYYVSPLIKVLLGYIFLRERLSAAQITSVILAFIGVAILGVSHGEVPKISIGLAFVSGWYGLLRKKTTVDGPTGLAFELLLLTPVALVLISYLQFRGELAFAHGSTDTDLLLMAAGVITAIPMLWYCKALRRLPYSTIGILMYIMPSLTFLIAVFVFEESFDTAQLAAFCCVWVALVVFSCDVIRRRSISNRAETVVIRQGQES